MDDLVHLFVVQHVVAEIPHCVHLADFTVFLHEVELHVSLVVEFRNLFQENCEIGRQGGYCQAIDDVLVLLLPPEDQGSGHQHCHEETNADECSPMLRIHMLQSCMHERRLQTLIDHAWMRGAGNRRNDDIGECKQTEHPERNGGVLEELEEQVNAGTILLKFLDFTPQLELFA